MNFRKRLSSALGLIIAEVVLLAVFIFVLSFILVISDGSTENIKGNIFYKIIPSLLNFLVFLNLSRFNNFFKISFYFRSAHTFIYFLNIFTSEAFGFDFYNTKAFFCIPLIVGAALSVLIELYFLKGMAYIFKELQIEKYLKFWKNQITYFTVFYIIYSVLNILSNFNNLFSILTGIMALPCAVIAFIQFVYHIKSVVLLRKIEKNS